MKYNAQVYTASQLSTWIDPFLLLLLCSLSNHERLPRDESVYLVTTEMLLSRTEGLSVRGRVLCE